MSSGIPTPSDVDAALERWNEGNNDISLIAYLGWSWEEYAAWVDDENKIPARPLRTLDTIESERSRALTFMKIVKPSIGRSSNMDFLRSRLRRSP